MIENFLDDNLVLLNDGTPTHFCARSGNLTCMELSICTPTLAPNLTWEVLKFYHGGNHFPIQINIQELQNTNNTAPAPVQTR